MRKEKAKMEQEMAPAEVLAEQHYQMLKMRKKKASVFN